MWLLFHYSGGIHKYMTGLLVVISEELILFQGPNILVIMVEMSLIMLILIVQHDTGPFGEGQGDIKCF